MTARQARVTPSDSSPMNDSIALPAQSLDFETKYHNVIDVQFVSRALNSGANYIRGATWATQTLYPGNGPEVLATAYYAYNRSFEALALVEGALAHVIRQGDTATLRLASSDPGALDRAERRIRAQLPEPEKGQAVNIEFSHLERAMVQTTSRTVPVPRLDEIEQNYSSGVREQLGAIAHGFSPGIGGGRLLLWHGLPGCGKTWALRALAWEWREWCTVRYITDPEVFLREPGYMVNLLHMRNGRDDEASWRLIVMEDTGELLTADAKQQSGQGLSRMLNVVDGLLGESAQALFLVTTNEDLRTVHPAISRPGRCAQQLEFDALAPAEANAWLADAGCDTRVSVPATLAELYAIEGGADVAAARRVPVGFG